MSDQQMSGETFRAIRKALGKSQTEMAAALGISRPSVELYERGFRRDDGRPVEIPKSIRLALAAVVLGVTDYLGGPVRITNQAEPMISTAPTRS